MCVTDLQDVLANATYVGLMQCSGVTGSLDIGFHARAVQTSSWPYSSKCHYSVVSCRQHTSSNSQP